MNAPVKTPATMDVIRALVEQMPPIRRPEYGEGTVLYPDRPHKKYKFHTLYPANRRAK